MRYSKHLQSQLLRDGKKSDLLSMGPMPGACVYIKIKYNLVLYPKTSLDLCSETDLNQVLEHSPRKELEHVVC